MVQAVTKSFEAHAINNFAYKGTHEELACFTEADTTLLHIEESIFVELTYGSTVATLHIIGINLELRLGIHTRRASEA